MCCVVSSFREALERKKNMQTSGLASVRFTWVIIRELWRYFFLVVCVYVFEYLQLDTQHFTQKHPNFECLSDKCMQI